MTPKPPIKLFSPKARVKIGQWNVRTMYETGKCAQVVTEMKRFKLDILGISEMRWNGCGTMTTATGETILYSGKEDQNDNHEQGVGIILSKHASSSLMEWEPISARVITARFRSRWRNVSVIQCYAPTNSSEEEIKDEFYEELQSLMDKVPKRDIVILMGDLNAKVGTNNTGIENVMGRQGAKCMMNENGELLTEFCAVNELTLGGTLFPHKECHKITWVSPDGKTQNQIDHIAINCRWKSSLEDVRVKRGADIGSDHHLVIGKIKIRLAKVVKRKSLRTRFNTKKLQESEVRDTFVIKLQNRFESLYTEEEEEGASAGADEAGIPNGKQKIEQQWSKIKSSYIDTCEEVLGRQREENKGWISEDTWKKIEHRKTAKNEVNVAKTRNQIKQANRKYQEANREVKRSCRRDKRNYVNNLAQEAENAAMKGDLGTLYNITKNLSGRSQNRNKPIRDIQGRIIKNMEEELKRWKNHFEQVLNRQDPHNPPDLTEGPELAINTGTISKAEIREALKSLKNGKAAGPDNIPAEAIKAGGDISVSILHEFLNEVWNEEELPEDWTTGYLVKLAKKGDLSYCDNWRGIMLLSIASKVLCRVVFNRMRRAVDTKLRNEQAGFRQGRSCTDHIATLRIIVEQSVEWQSSAYICFVDFQKAFDSIHRETLWKLLRHYGIPAKIVTIITKFYDGFTAQVVHNGRLTDKFQMLTGVRQGCLLSPLLFLIAIDWVTRQAYGASNKGICWQMMNTLEDLEFADDIALLTHRLQDMRCKIEDLRATGERVGLRVNASKTKLMKVMTKQEGTVHIGQEAVEEVKEFQYLGSIISTTGGASEDIQARIRKARHAFALLRPIWRTKSLSLRSKLRIFTSNVKSLLLYGSETWRMTATLVNKLQVFQNKCLRRIIGIRWPEKIRNEDLWHRTGQVPIELELKKRAWRWIGHTLRREDNNIARVALEWNPQGKRRRGRPLQSWRRTRLAELKDRSISWQDCKRRAGDRTRWKDLVEALCSS